MMHVSNVFLSLHLLNIFSATEHISCQLILLRFLDSNKTFGFVEFQDSGCRLHVIGTILHLRALNVVYCHPKRIERGLNL